MLLPGKISAENMLGLATTDCLVAEAPYANPKKFAALNSMNVIFKGVTLREELDAKIKGRKL